MNEVTNTPPPILKQKGNHCGIVGMCVGWAVPIAGVVLGIIALARGEKTKSYGIISIVESLVFWVLWAAYMAASR